MCMEQTSVVHACELRGLGRAPFRLKQVIDSGHVKNGRPCQFCGTALRYLYVIEDADNKTAVVGSECIRKSGDKGLINLVKQKATEERARLRFEQREQERAAWREANADRLELESKAREHSVYERNRALETHKARFAWLLQRLSEHCGDFCYSMVCSIKAGTDPSALSERARAIICEILAKDAGRRGSKAYNAAESRLIECFESGEWPTLEPTEPQAPRGQL